MADGTGAAGELLRRELSGVRLLQWTLLVLGLCAGTGMVTGGFHDRVRDTTTSPSAALGSLIAGILVTLAALALSTLLALTSRDRTRLLRAYGPEGLALAPPLRGARAAWTTLSSLGLLLGALFLGAGLMDLTKDDPYDESDPYVYGALLLWAALLGAAGVAGLAKSRRFRAPRGPGALPASVRGVPGVRAVSRPEPAVPHPLFVRLNARMARLPRSAAVALTLLATLVGCALTAATALLPTHLGNGAFWLLFLGTAGYLLALLLGLFVPQSLGPAPTDGTPARTAYRQRYAVLFVCAGVGLIVTAGNGFNAATLLDRGEWADTNVAQVRHPSKGGPSCELRPYGRDTTLEKRLSPCRDLSVGDEIRVFHDPEGEAAPRRSEPDGLRGLTIAWSVLTALALVLALLSSRYAHTTRTRTPSNSSAPATPSALLPGTRIGS